jgi:hypothetical protein
MRAPIPTLAALLLLAVISMQSVHLGLFEVRRQVVRKEMKQRIRQGLPQHALVRFSFTREAYKALEKEDGGREFWLDGHIYDVVRSTTDADGTVRIEAVDDRDEARLMAGLKELIEQGMDQRGQGRDKARAVIAMLAAALPEGRQAMALPPALPVLHGIGVKESALEGVMKELFRPPWVWTVRRSCPGAEGRA